MLPAFSTYSWWWNPFQKIWDAIYDLLERVEDIEEFVNEISRVELLSTHPIEVEVIDEETGEVVEITIVGYYYQFGVSGVWNVSKIQTEPIMEKLNSILTDFESIDLRHWAGVNPFYEDGGYEREMAVHVYGDRELTEAEIETVRLLIEEYLTHL